MSYSEMIKNWLFKIANSQRAECSQNIPPKYNIYEQERQKLLKDKSK